MSERLIFKVEKIVKDGKDLKIFRSKDLMPKKGLLPPLDLFLMQLLGIC
jgi:hypothetical protein